MTTQKKAALKTLEGIGVPKERRRFVLAYVPFYLSCYETPSKRRYVIYPPSIVSSMGVLTKLKGALGAARIRSLLQPRSKAVTTLLNQVVALIQEDPVFEKEINEAGVKVSILRSIEAQISIKNGLQDLRNEKWISDSERQTLIKLVGKR